MASKVGIWNQALQRLGTRRVETDTEATAEAEALNAVYDDVRQFVLEQHPWAFSRKTVQLVRLVEEPLEVWKYFYQLPNEIIKVLRASDGPNNYEWQTGSSIPFDIQADERLATDAEEVVLFYTFDETDPNKWPPTFRSALGWRLAYEVAALLTESSGKQDRAEERYLREIEQAKSLGAIKSRIRPVTPTSWTLSREAGSGSLYLTFAQH